MRPSSVVATDSDMSESTGIGTKNIAAMMEAMGGFSQSSCDGEAFETTLSFRKARGNDAHQLAAVGSCEVEGETLEHD